MTLDRPLQGTETEIFASGKLLLEDDDRPCLPAEMEVAGENQAILVLHEGRYHQVRRMFAAVGNHVTELTRTDIGVLSLVETGLDPGEHVVIEPKELLQRVSPE